MVLEDLAPSLGSSLMLLVVGIVLYVIGKYAPIEPVVNRILWILGLILILIGVVLLIFWAVTVAIPPLWAIVPILHFF